MITNEQDRETLRRAIEVWGVDTQFLMCAGEFGELLTHIGRYAQGRFDTAQASGD